MSSELKKRLVTTLALLFATHVLGYFPIPLINFDSLLRLMNQPDFSLMTAMDVGTIGALGINPYVIASLFVVFIFYFRKLRNNVDDRNFPIEFYTLILTGVISLAQGYSIAVFLESVRLEDGTVIVNDAGWGSRFVIMLSITTGTYLFVWLARLITQKGIGNGVCLLFLIQFLTNMPFELFDFVNGDDATGEDVVIRLISILLLAGFILVAISTFILGKWKVPLNRTALTKVPNANISLQMNSIGTAGLIPTSWVLVIISYLTFLPLGSFLENLTVVTPLRLIVHSIVAFVVTYLLVAMAYNPRGIQNILRKFDNSPDVSKSYLEDGQFDKRLAIMTLPLALAVPVIFNIFSWLVVEYSLYWLASFNALIVVAICLATFRQLQCHRKMSMVQDETNYEMVCENCEIGVSDQETFCPNCGLFFEDDVKCEKHIETQAEAQCIICQRKLCPECTDKNNDRFTCDEHSCVELIEGWATALTTTTRLEAELHKCRLESGGLSALVHSNTIEPIYGTLGLFEINPVTPFFVYRELGGGFIRVMVPMHDWTNAQESLQSY